MCQKKTKAEKMTLSLSCLVTLIRFVIAQHQTNSTDKKASLETQSDVGEVSVFAKKGGENI